MLPLAGWLSEFCCDPDFHEPTALSPRKKAKKLYQLLQDGTNIPVPVFKGKPALFLPTEILTGYTTLFGKCMNMSSTSL